MYHINEDAPQWATDTANVIKSLTPAVQTVRGIVQRPKGSAPMVQTVPAPSVKPSKGINTQTLLIGAAVVVALYFVFKKKR